MTPVIRLEKVTKRFGAETALDEVSIEVPPGMVFALLGENGAGKTTAIRIMLGLAEPNSGRAEVLGLGSAGQGLLIRQRVGYVPERPTLYDWMTVEEIGWFTAGFYGPGFLPEYLRLAAQFGLPAGKRLKTLSKGMYAKVVLSLALAHQPEVLILDEPTSGLDALVRREFLDSMVDRAAQGQTVFLSSHQIVEVERVADVVAILRRGKLLLVEPLEQLKAQVRRLTVTLKDGAASPLDICGAGVPLASPLAAGETPAPQILSQRSKPRQWQGLVRGMTDGHLAAIQGHETVEAVEVHAASLEDIFVAYMQSDGSSEPAKQREPHEQEIAGG
jgi:ABC-2 type transport system ATP-binding protein